MYVGDIMERIKLGPWVIDVDVSRTKRFYEEFHFITEDCSCSYCANYILACEKFPPEIKNLFDSLGINPCKEREVSEFMENDDGTHLYHSFYHIVGRVIEGPKLDEKETSTYNLTGFEIGFTENIDLVPEKFPRPTLQIEFEMNIPWVLD